MNLEIITVAVKASELETDDLCFFLLCQSSSKDCVSMFQL